MSYRACLFGVCWALVTSGIGCSSGGYIGDDITDLTAPGGPRDAALADGQTPADGATMRPDAAAMADMASVPNSWSAFGKTFLGGPAICKPVDSGSGPYFLTTSVTESPYHCQLGVDFMSRPTADGVYPISALAPPQTPTGSAYVLMLDYRTGSYEAWHSLDAGQVTVKVSGSQISITVQGAVLKGGVGGAPDEPVSGLLVCP